MNGNKLKKLRKDRNLKQEELANLLNISASTIGMYEQGRREPDNATLKKIANFFEVSTDYLLDNYSSSKRDFELIEKGALKKALIEAGYMKENEDLSKEELERLMEFVRANKKYIRKDEDWKAKIIWKI